MENNSKDSKKKTQDEIWDEQLESEESLIFFEHLDKQIEDALTNGDFFEDEEIPNSDKKEKK